MAMKRKLCRTLSTNTVAVLIAIIVCASLLVYTHQQSLFKNTTTVSTSPLGLPHPPHSSASPDPPTEKQKLLYPTIHDHHQTSWKGLYTRLGSNLSFDDDLCQSSAFLKPKQSVPITDRCPNVLIVGARKAGTTSLYQYLSQHPDFAGIRLDWGYTAGETWFFSSQFSLKDLDSYLDNFSSQQGKQTGESTVDYLVNCLVPQRVTRVCKTLPKIIVLLRNPVTRFVSNFNMRVSLIDNDSPYELFDQTYTISRTINVEIQEFKSHLKTAEVSLQSPLNDWDKMRCLFSETKSMIFEGVYHVHLLNWLCSYPRDKILILQSEEFYKKPALVMMDVLSFLGLRLLEEEHLREITSQVYNKGNYSSAPKHRLHSYERTKLKEVYQDYNKHLSTLLNWKELQW